MNFFETIKSLFPHSRAFQLIADSNKRKLLEALSELPEDVRRSAETVYLDLFPETTRYPAKWEKVFSLFLTEAEYPKRRDILSALWKTISGNQGTDFMEQALRSIHPDFKVIENVPAIDPRNKHSVGLAVCDYYRMVCDGEVACCDYLAGSKTFIPGVLQNDTSVLYAIPDDKRFWETCFFICKTVHRNDVGEILYIEPLELNKLWRNIVEYLILKIKPVHSTAVVFVEWLEEDVSVTA
jgi:hypothetical protein